MATPDLSPLGISWDELEPAPPAPVPAPKPARAPRPVAPRPAPQPLSVAARVEGSNVQALEERAWKAGVLVDLKVSYFRAHAGLSAEEIGADETKTNLEIVRLGRKDLFAERMTRPLKQAEARARNALTKRGFAFPIGGARFVPFKAFPILEAELRAAKEEFERAAETFVATYDANKAEMLAQFPGMLKESDYPSKTGLRFDIEYHTFTLAPSDGDAAERIRGAIEEFVGDAVETLRGRVLDTVRAQAERLENGRPVSERQLGSLRRMVEDFGALNFVGDNGLENALASLKDQLNLRDARTYKDNTEAQTELKRVLDLVAEAASKTEDVNQSVAGFTGRALTLDAPGQEA